MPGKSQRPAPAMASGSAKDASKTPEVTATQQLLSPDGKPLKQAQVQVAPAPQVELYGFRGVRTVNGDKVKDMAVDDPRKQDVDRITASHHLLFAGHVGVSVDKGSTIYGLTPAFPEGMSPEQGIDHLYNHSMTFPGTVANDKPVFDMAGRYHQEKGWNTDVHVAKRTVSQEQQADYLHQLQSMIGAVPGSHGVYYSFPLSDAQDGSFFVDTPSPSGNIIKGDNQSNCATFPAQIGVELPEQSGNLRYYIPALAAEAASRSAS